MTGEGNEEGVPDGALNDIAYLSRSGSRVTILDAIAAESHSQSELETRTGIARTTVGRVINEFEERGWARRTNNGEYTATPSGERIITEFKPFVETVEVIRTLGDLVGWLPLEEAPINLHHFADATIHRPEPADPMSTVTEFNTRLEDTDEFQCLVRIAPPIPFERAMCHGVRNRDLETKHVITDDEYTYLLNHPERVARWQEYLDDGANVYRYEGEIPCNLFVFDDTVLITNTTSEIGEPHVGIKSSNSAVVTWAKGVIEEYRGESQRLDSTAFAIESSDYQES